MSQKLRTKLFILELIIGLTLICVGFLYYYWLFPEVIPT